MIKEISEELVNKTFLKKSKKTIYTSYLGYFNANELVGYLEYNIIYDRLEICYIFVNENKRSQQIGYKLLKKLIKLGENKKFYNITLEVNITNNIAISLYKKLGFIEKALRKGYYNGIDGILMELIL